MTKRTWARKAELVALWAQMNKAEKTKLAKKEGQSYSGLGSSVRTWKNDHRINEVKSAPRRKCRGCGELKTLDQFELTRRVRKCIVCERPVESEPFVALRRKLTRFTLEQQTQLISEYRAISTDDRDRDRKRLELAERHGVQLTTLTASVYRWEAARRQATRVAPQGLGSDSVTDWLLVMFEDLDMDQDIQNSILAHRVRFQRGISNAS